jgi:hypothetical protein
MDAYMPSVGRAGLLQMALASGTIGKSFFVYLAQNDFDETDPDLELGDLTQADFSGYSAVEVSAGTVTIDSNGDGQFVLAEATFSHNGGGTSNTIYGYYIRYAIDGSPASLLWVVKFAAPISMAIGTDVISRIFRAVMGQYHPLP